MSKDKNPTAGQGTDNDLEKYRDSSGVSLKEMNFGLWVSENRRRLKNILVAILIAACTFFLVFSAYSYIVYFLEKPAADNLFAQTLNNVAPLPLTQDLSVGPLLVFTSGAKYDLVVEVKNPNPRFSGIFEYCFSTAAADLFCARSFILPDQTKYVLSLGQTLSVAPSDLTFKIKSIAWSRVNAHDIPDWPSFLAARLNVNISNLRFAAASSGRSGEIDLSTVQFDVRNDSAYGYYEGPLNILIYNGSSLVGVNRYIISNFQAGETRHVNLTWSGSFNRSDTVVVTPDINVLDDSQYLKYQGESAANQAVGQ